MKSVLCLLVFIGITLASVPQSLGQIPEHRPGFVKEEFIWLSAPFAQCHASTIAQASDGTLVAAWFGGLREGDHRVGIWLSRCENGQWTKPFEVANGRQANGSFVPTWNPVLFQPSSGPLQLHFKVGPSPSRWHGEMMISEDNGKTWTDRHSLPENGIGPVKNKPVELAHGRILCGSSVEIPGGAWLVHVETLSKDGTLWTRSAPLHTAEQGQAIQPTILKLGGEAGGSDDFSEHILLLCRNRDGRGKILAFESSDGGRTFGELTETELPNPNSGIDAVSLRDGRQLLVYNHTNTTAEDGQPRSRDMINLALSNDGWTWRRIAVLECASGSEFSYPAVIQARDGLIHVIYTWNRRLIKHMIFDPVKLEDNKSEQK